jgi:Protein of unknown function (DUF4232)
MRTRAVIAVAVVCGVTACHHSDTARLVTRNVATAPGVVPWSDSPAPHVTPSPAPTPTAAYDDCTASQLSKASVDGSGPAAGTFYEDLRVTNTSDRPCTLTGGPAKVVGVRADGSQTTLDDAIGPNDIALKGPGPVNMRPGEHAWLTLATADGCDAVIAGRHDRVASLVVVLRDGGKVDVNLPDPLDIVCGVSASEFGAAAPPSPDETSPLDVLRAELHVPDTVPPGEPLDFTVTLTNTSDHDVTLSPCPSYAEAVFPIQTAHEPSIERYCLNCDALKQIAAGSSVTLAMQIDVPDGAGLAKFWWMVQGTTLGAARGVTLG